MKNGNWKTYLLIFLIFQFHQLVLACPVCFAANEKSRIAFYITTALLTFLPLMLMGGFILWYRNKLRKLTEKNI